MTHLRSVLTGIITLSCSYLYPCNGQHMPSIPVNQLVLPAGGHTIPFEWHTGTVHGKQEPYAALLIPVTLPGQTRPYYMQFDLGSPFSMFYKEELKNMQIA